MSDNISEETLASYIGVSGPETPKFLLANNFLSEFFQPDQSDKLKRFMYDDFSNAGILNCEEDDEQKKQVLKASFNRFFQHFSGEDMIHSRYNNQYFYFPVKPQMLKSSSYNLRHLLFNMIPNIEDKDKFNHIRELMERYLYSESTGVDYLLGELCAHLNDKGHMLRTGGRSREFSYLRKQLYRDMCNRFNKDLECLLTHPFFRELDFYRRYDYLATLLNNYVIQFILKRSSENGGAEKGYILCQGAASSHLLNMGEFHRACVQNYAEIRSVFPKKLKEFYIHRLEAVVGKDNKIELIAEKGHLRVNKETFEGFIKKVFNSNLKETESLYSSVKKVYKIAEEEKIYSFTANEFAMYFIDISKARKGSSLTKISSTLPTVGKDMDFIFPKNRSRHKFFAMSPSLLEFHIRLYLAKEERTYAYLDSFFQYLEEYYHICIIKSESMDRVLRKLQIKVPFHEFRLNEQVLLESLEEINCLIRLSDSGYVITLPEEKGEFNLL